MVTDSTVKIATITIRRSFLRDEQCDGVITTATDSLMRMYKYSSMQMLTGWFWQSGCVFGGMAVADRFVEDNTDCDDLRTDVFAGADEVCDGLDNN